MPLEFDLVASQEALEITAVRGHGFGRILVEKVHEAMCVAKTECLQEGLSGLTV